MSPTSLVCPEPFPTRWLDASPQSFSQEVSVKKSVNFCQNVAPTKLLKQETSESTDMMPGQSPREAGSEVGSEVGLEPGEDEEADLKRIEISEKFRERFQSRVSRNRATLRHREAVAVRPQKGIQKEIKVSHC